jgi:hypothetical protein
MANYIHTRYRWVDNSDYFSVELTMTWCKKRTWGSLMTQELLGLLSSTSSCAYGLSIYFYGIKGKYDAFFYTSSFLTELFSRMSIYCFIWGYHLASIKLNYQ